VDHEKAPHEEGIHQLALQLVQKNEKKKRSTTGAASTSNIPG
jgi:hypothetical protein